MVTEKCFLGTFLNSVVVVSNSLIHEAQSLNFLSISGVWSRFVGLWFLRGLLLLHL